MIITKLSGGLGNQMFQYAAARSLSLKWHQKLMIDTSLFSIHHANVDKRSYALGIFKNIRPVFSNNFLSSGFYMHSRWDNRIRNIAGIKKRKVLKEITHSFNNSFNEIEPPVLLDGFWQSEKYFKLHQNIIRSDFEFSEFDEKDKNIHVLEDILRNESVSVHVRRGDYVKYGTDNMFSGLCDSDYFQMAIKKLSEEQGNKKFYFFSEDPEWVKNNLIHDNLNATIVTGNTSNYDSWKDLYLISKCKHHIISNSSFSWWGAWLNNNPAKRVIAPKIWFKTYDPFYLQNDIVPESWIRL